jgi:2-dehydropantoate 2-reductase
MKTAIIGTGAMGSVYAGLLGAAGHEVWAVDRWRAHLDAIAENGLRLEGASGDRTVALRTSETGAEVGTAELVIIATKAMHIESAAETAAGMVGPDTTVLAIQNGLGSAEKVADRIGADRVAIGVVGGFGASILAPGHAHHNGWELVRLGEMNGPVTPRLEAIAEVWRSGGFKVRTFDDIHQMVWEKLICNVCYSGTCALSERTIGEVQANPHLWQVASGCATEAYTVARAKNIALEFDDPVAYVRAFGEKIPNARPSMLLDRQAGRRAEIGAINGAIPPLARPLGILTPHNDTVVALIRGYEQYLPEA